MVCCILSILLWRRCSMPPHRVRGISKFMNIAQKTIWPVERNWCFVAARRRARQFCFSNPILHHKAGCRLKTFYSGRISDSGIVHKVGAANDHSALLQPYLSPAHANSGHPINVPRSFIPQREVRVLTSRMLSRRYLASWSNSMRLPDARRSSQRVVPCVSILWT